MGIPELESAIEKIGLIANSFRRFVTGQPLNLQVVNVENLINKEVSLYKQAGEKPIVVNISAPLPECKWDPLQISQAIAELLENAIYYTPAEGKILIGAETLEKGSVSMLRITVYNDGLGVDHENKTKIFEPFFSTRSDGVGLGLAIAAKTIEAHKGTIYEAGEPGRNAKFVIEAPAVPQVERYL